MNSRYLVIIATYNEAQNITNLVEKLLATGEEIDVLVVDDNSPDGTGRLAELLSEKNPHRVHVLHRPGKLGLGTAYHDGFKLALEKRYERVVTVDADFSHPVEIIPLMIGKLSEAGLVIGSRYVSGGKIENWPLKRKINSRVANFMARLLMGLKTRDCTSGFRAYRSEYLKKVPMDELIARGYSALPEFLYFFQKSGAPVVEVPITFINRQEGKSKISSREIREAIKVMLYYWWHRPEL